VAIFQSDLFIQLLYHVKANLQFLPVC